MKGWEKDLTKMTNAEQLPETLMEYIDYLETELEIPIKIVNH